MSGGGPFTFAVPGGGGGSGGGGSDFIAADHVTYSNDAHPEFETAKDALDALFYVPTDITAMSGGSNNEIGSSVASIDLAWTINKDVTSQSIDNGVGTVSAAARTKHVDGPFTSNTTFTLTASDGETTDHASTSISFFRNRYWTTAADPNLKDDQSAIRALTKEFATNRNKAITYDCTGGQYPYYIYPTSFGALSAVTVGGLAFSDYVQDTISFTNASGHTEDYYVTRFNGIQTGASIAVVWA